MEEHIARLPSFHRSPLPLDLESPTTATYGTSAPHTSRPRSPGAGPDLSTSGPSDPSGSPVAHQHKRRSKGESTLPRRKPSSHPSPLNPSTSRHPSYGKRRAAAENAFEHNPMFEEGMDIFQDPLASGPVVDSKVLELQRRARELGPAPLPPPKSPKTPQSQTFSPILLQSPASPTTAAISTPIGSPIRQSLDAHVASVRGQNRSPIMSPNMQSPPLGLIPLSPSPSPGRAPSPLGLERVQSFPTESPATPPHMKGKHSLGHLISDIKRISKGKDREEDPVEQLAREHRAEERIAAIRASPVAQDAQLLQRVGLAAQQLSRRYEAIYRALAAGEAPPNPLEVIRWRETSLRNPSTLQPLHAPTAKSLSLDVPKTILEESSEGEAHPWNGVGERQKGWYLPATMYDKYTGARREARKYGSVLHDSPRSQEFLLPRATVERRVSDGTTAGKSSTSGGSGRNLSGPSSFRLPFTTTGKVSTDRLSSSSSQKSRDGLDSFQPLTPLPNSRKVSPASGMTFPSSIDEQTGYVHVPVTHPSSKPPEAPRMEKARTTDSRTSMDTTGGSKSPSKTRRIRNSLPGYIDPAKISQLLSPRSASAGIRPGSPPLRSHTSPKLGGKALSVSLGQAVAHQQSDDGELSGRSSFSDNPLSPNQSAGEDGGAARRSKQTGQRKQSRLAELAESDEKDERLRAGSLPSHLEVAPVQQDASTSEDDISSRIGLGIARAGKKAVSKSWNALTKKDDHHPRRKLYDERAAAGAVDGASRRHGLFRLDTSATERAGTTSDRMLRSGLRPQPITPRPTHDEEAQRLAKKKELEEIQADAYKQRESLIEESHIESQLISEAMRGAVTAITDYITNQSVLADHNALGINLDPKLTEDIFEVLHPPSLITGEGYKSVEENFQRRSEYLATFDARVNNLGLPHWPSTVIDTPLQAILDRIPHLQSLVEQMVVGMEHIREEIDDAVEEQSIVRTELADVEVLLTVTAEKVDTPFPELARNDELARQLGPENVVQVLPEWVPSWAQAILFALSPIVRWLAETILLALKHKRVFSFIPEKFRASLVQFLLACAITFWNVTVQAYRFLSSAISHPTAQSAFSSLRPLVDRAKHHPLVSTVAFTSLFWMLFNYASQHRNSALSNTALVAHANS